MAGRRGLFSLGRVIPVPVFSTGLSGGDSSLSSVVVSLG